MLNENEQLERFQLRQAIIRDRVRAVARRLCAGAYVCGRAGTGKTHTVLGALRAVGAPYHYHAGHVSAMGLFEMLGEHPDETIVLDDVAMLFADRVGTQIALAALGTQPHAPGPRLVKYQRMGRQEVVSFSGGVIAISNLQLHASPLLDALRSRVHVIHYDPSDDEVAAAMLRLSRLGWPADEPKLSPEECLLVANFVIAESRRMARPLDFRLLMGKSFADFLQHREGESELHWKDLVLASLSEADREPRHTPRQSREQRKLVEQQIAERLRREHADDVEDQLRHWEDETGKSRRSFWRRLRDAEGGTERHAAP